MSGGICIIDVVLSPRAVLEEISGANWSLLVMHAWGRDAFKRWKFGKKAFGKWKKFWKTGIYNLENRKDHEISPNSKK